ncbi:hypothetical protein SC499_25985 [Peribacillus simplex]|uniref:hypothetical protein n=1 Tax=Peribacillus simplex TaxID=1478 RepID=UPI00298D957E|nr:hypothetical protein [Peribacillus simplex]MDW7618007.1 hypothetical protein [Peribacillus simplex]
MNSDVTNKKELDKVLHWSMDVPSLFKVPIIREANKRKSRKHHFHRFWGYLTFTGTKRKKSAM